MAESYSALNDFSETESISSSPSVPSSIFSLENPPAIVDATDIDLSISTDICSHSNTKEEENITICIDCGLELYERVTREQEWRYFGDDSNPGRVQYRKQTEKGIRKELERLGFSPDICDLANRLFLQITNGKLKKNDLRKGLLFSTTFEAHKILGKPRTPDELQAKFGYNLKIISNGIAYFRLKCPREYFNYEDVGVKHFIPQIMQKLQATQEHIDNVLRLYEKLKDACPILNRSNPQSASKAIVYYYLRRRKVHINVTQFSRMFRLSDSILYRIASEISRVLGSENTVDLT